MLEYKLQMSTCVSWVCSSAVLSFAITFMVIFLSLVNGEEKFHLKWRHTLIAPLIHWLHLLGKVLGGHVHRTHHGQFDSQSNILRGAMSCKKLSITFLTHSCRVKAYLFLRYCRKNQSTDVAWGALHDLLWIFEYITTGLFAGLISIGYATKITDIPQFQLRLTIGNISKHIYAQCF